MMMVTQSQLAERDLIHKAVDELSPESLRALGEFVAFLQYKEARPKGSPWLKELYDHFAPIRDAIAESGMTEDEINAVIDEAIEEVRSERKS